MRSPLKTILVALLLLTLAAGARAALQVGDALPSQLRELDAPETKGRVVLLDFWASWCAPCKASFPMLAQLHHDFAAQGLLVIGVGVDEKPAAYTSFLQKMSPPFVTVHDHRQQLVTAAGVPAMPSSYLFGRDGRLHSIHRGFHGRATAEALRREIKSLLGEKVPAP